MARLKVFPYELQSTERAQHYFLNGLRKGFLFALYTDDHRWGMGEYAPLLGIHSVSLEDALTMLGHVNAQHVENFLLSPDPSSKIKDFPYPLSFLLSTMHQYHACLQRKAPTPDQKLVLSALVTAPLCEQAVSEAAHFLRLGFCYLKVKIGKLPIALEIEKIMLINSLSEGKAILRLDANKRYSMDDALQLVQGVSGANIQYFEEPLADAAGISRLKERCRFDFAIDESYDEGLSLASLKARGISYLIIKASRFKSLFVVRSMVLEARACGIRPIFSTCFESEFFSSLMALLVAELGLLEEAHGLWCPEIFANTLWDFPLLVSKGELSLDDAYRLIGVSHVNALHS